MNAHHRVLICPRTAELGGDAERTAGVVEGEPPVGRVVCEHAAQLIGQADPPGGAGGDLLAGHEAVVEPPQQGRRRDIELAGGLGHVERLSFRFAVAGAGLVARNFPVPAQ
jgi:hypothetical protein